MQIRDFARAAVAGQNPGRPAEATGVDLPTQLEGLLDAVWRAEREWALDDRIDLAWKLQRRSVR